MKKKPIALLLSLLLSLNIMAVSAAAEEPAASDSFSAKTNTSVSETVPEEGIEVTSEPLNKSDIQKSIEIVNNIDIPEGDGLSPQGVELTEEESAAMKAVLEYDRANNELYAVPLTKNDIVNTYETNYYYNQLSDNGQDVYDGMYKVCSEVLNSTQSYSSSWFATTTLGSKLSLNDAVLIYQLVTFENPEFFFLDLAYSYDSNYLYLHMANSCINGTVRANKKAYIDNLTSSWLSEVNKLNGSIAKEKWIAEKLCNTITYEYYGDREHQSILGAFYNKKCVCAGYAKAMSYLCNAIGLECVYVLGPDHAWNRILLYGKWYEVDVTWMDNDNGTINYTWFNKSTATFRANDDSRECHHTDSSKLTWEVNVNTRISYPVCSYNDPTDPVAIDEQKAAAFVERLYTTLMGRASDPIGKANHINSLKAGKSACDVAKGFVLSTELKGKKLTNKEFVTRMYKTMLDRNPDAAGLEKWTKALDNGCSYGFVLQGLCGSTEFTNLCKSYGITRGTYKSPEYRDYNANLTAYVSRMYTVAMGRSYDVTGLNNHTRNYINKTKDAKGIAKDFIFSPEFKGKNLTDEQFVECMYNTLFGRPSDAAGKNSWLSKLRSGYSREYVFNGFTGADEFKRMVAGFGV